MISMLDYSEWHHIQSQRARRAAGIVSDSLAAASLKVNSDADITLKGQLVAIEPESRVASFRTDEGRLLEGTIRNCTALDATPHASPMDSPMTTVPTHIDRGVEDGDR
jgi:hypothetical protein